MLRVKGGNIITVRDVLIGEVWVCSGQSNMVFPLIAATDGRKEVQSARNPQIRLFQTPNVMANTPQDDIDSKWAVCDSRSALKFSAVGYFFGKRLHDRLDVPIGLIDSSWAGTPAEGWTPPGGAGASCGGACGRRRTLVQGSALAGPRGSCFCFSRSGLSRSVDD